MIGAFAALALIAGAARADTPDWPLSLGSCALLDAKPGEVKSLYWELYQHTEVCVNVIPEPGPDGPSPLVLTFSFTYVGREMKAPPRAVLLRAQLPPMAMLASASFSLVLDEKDELDLTAPGQEYRLTSPPQCTGPDSGCGFAGVEIPLSPQVFARLANAKRIGGKAFGSGFSLSPAARAGLSAFAVGALAGGSAR